MYNAIQVEEENAVKLARGLLSAWKIVQMDQPIRIGLTDRRFRLSERRYL
jgi:hypothetical protein